MKREIYNLLDNKERKCLCLLGVLSQEETWRSSEQLRDALGLSARTIHRYMEDIEQLIFYFNKRQLGEVRLHQSKYKGWLLEYDRLVNYSSLEQFVFSTSDIIDLLNQLFLNRFGSVAMYKQNKFISESTIRKMLARITLFLKQHHLSLTKGNFQIMGDEYQIRHLFYSFYWCCYNDVGWPFSNIEEAKLTHVVDKVLENIRLDCSLCNKEELKYLLACSISRYHSKHKFHVKECLRPYVNFGLMPETHTCIQPILKEFHIFDNEEQAYYILLFQTLPFFYHSELFRQEVVLFHKQTDTASYQLMKKLRDSFESHVVGIPNPLNEFFEANLLAANMHLLVSPELSLDISGRCAGTYQLKNQVELNKKIKNTIQEVYKDYSNKEGLSYIHEECLEIFLLIKPPTYFESSIKVRIDTDLPFPIEERIKEALISRYQHLYHIECVNKIDSKQKGVDIILTTNPNFQEKLGRSELTTVFAFQYPIKEREVDDLDNIMKEYSGQMKRLFI